MSTLWLRYRSGSIAGGVTSFISTLSMTEHCKASYWLLMKDALQEILKGGYHEFNIDAFQDEVAKVVLLKNSKSIYEEFTVILNAFLEEIVSDITSEPVSTGFLRNLINIWLEYKTHLIRIRNLFKILDRIVFYENEKHDIVSYGGNLFCEAAIHSDTMRPRIQNIIIELLMAEREGKIVDRMTLRKFCMILKCFGQQTYKKVFEEIFLQKSLEFYRKEAQRLLLYNDASSYLKGVRVVLKREKVRVNFCLLEETRKRNIELAEQELVGKHINTVINMDSSGLVHMLRKEMYDDIALMYSHVICVKEGLHIFADSLCLHLHNYWESALRSECFRVSNYEYYITCVSCLKDQLNYYITQCFNNNAFLKKRTYSVFTKVINMNCELAESLAMYVHSKLCTCTKSVSAYEKDKLLQHSMEIFRMLRDKDIFKYFYIKNLYKRLLHNKCSDDGSEHFIISRLKSECYAFSKRMHCMMEDMLLSNRLKEIFKEYEWYLQKKLNCPEIHVRVLTPACWPIRPEATSCIIPSRIHDAYVAFKNFYEGYMTERHLILLPQYGTCQIVSHFSKNIHLMYHPSVFTNTEIRTPMERPSVPLLVSNCEQQIVSKDLSNSPANLRETSCIIYATTYQMCILLLFNKYSQLTFEDIQRKTGIPHDSLKFALQSLSERNTNSLLKKKTTHTTDLYQVNNLFSPFQEDVNVMRIIERRDNEAEEKCVSINRLLRLDTVITRIMSARKTLPFHLIVAEVRAILRTEFHPSSVFILKRIETLVERKILKYKENSCNIYSIC